MSANSVIRRYTREFGTHVGPQNPASAYSKDDGQTPSQLMATRVPSTVARLFPSMHTLSSLSSISDPSRFSGKMTMHFEEDIGIIAQNSTYIGHGAQFDVRR